MTKSFPPSMPSYPPFPPFITAFLPPSSPTEQQNENGGVKEDGKALEEMCHSRASSPQSAATELFTSHGKMEPPTRSCTFHVEGLQCLAASLPRFLDPSIPPSLLLSLPPCPPLDRQEGCSDLEGQMTSRVRSVSLFAAHDVPQVTKANQSVFLSLQCMNNDIFSSCSRSCFSCPRHFFCFAWIDSREDARLKG